MTKCQALDRSHPTGQSSSPGPPGARARLSRPAEQREGSGGSSSQGWAHPGLPSWKEPSKAQCQAQGSTQEMPATTTSSTTAATAAPPPPTFPCTTAGLRSQKLCSAGPSATLSKHVGWCQERRGRGSGGHWPSPRAAALPAGLLQSCHALGTHGWCHLSPDQLFKKTGSVLNANPAKVQGLAVRRQGSRPEAQSHTPLPQRQPRVNGACDLVTTSGTSTNLSSLPPTTPQGRRSHCVKGMQIGHRPGLTRGHTASPGGMLQV